MPQYGNARYTFTLGPFYDGDFQWAVRIKDDQGLKSGAHELEYTPFSVLLPELGHLGSLGTTSSTNEFQTVEPPFSMPSRQTPAPPNVTTEEPPLVQTAPTSPLVGPSIKTNPSSEEGPPASIVVESTTTTTTTSTTTTVSAEENGPTTTNQSPSKRPPIILTVPTTEGPPSTTRLPPVAPTTTTATMYIPPDVIQPIPTEPATEPTTPYKPPTTPYQPPNNNPPGNGMVDYLSPLNGGTSTDPVKFEWAIKQPQRASMVLLYVQYPDGEEAYLTRLSTPSGYDEITLPLASEGAFRWSIWVQIDGGSFQEGPWHAFQVEASKGPKDPACGKNLGHYRERGQDLHKAVGRIMFAINGSNFLCSGTLVEGANDRAIIVTAAHCMYDASLQAFPERVMFIPGQDDGEGDASDYNCLNDPNGCFYPTAGVISHHYQKATFTEGFQYDYAFYVAPDTDPGNNNGPDRDTYGGKGPYKSLIPMGISFDGLEYGKNTYLMGYPGSRDPKFMYTEGRADKSPITQGGWYVDCSGLTGGASGGPWTQSNVSEGRMVVGSVNSWGWTNADSGMGSPPFDTGGAECVNQAANTADINGGYQIASCPK